MNLMYAFYLIISISIWMGILLAAMWSSNHIFKYRIHDEYYFNTMLKGYWDDVISRMYNILDNCTIIGRIVFIIPFTYIFVLELIATITLIVIFIFYKICTKKNQ